MKKSEFVARLFETPCESCPIQIFCRASRTFSCSSTARKYYDLVSNGEEGLQWPTLETESNLDSMAKA